MKDYPFYNVAQLMFGSYGDIDIGEYWAAMFILLLLSVVVCIFVWLMIEIIYDTVDERRASTVQLEGVLLEKEYEGRKVSSGTGVTTISTAGGMGVGITSTTSTTPEQFLLFIKADKIYKVPVDMQEYFNYEVGQKVKFNVKIGHLSKKELENFI